MCCNDVGFLADKLVEVRSHLGGITQFIGLA